MRSKDEPGSNPTTPVRFTSSGLMFYDSSTYRYVELSELLKIIDPEDERFYCSSQGYVLDNLTYQTHELSEFLAVANEAVK